MVATDSLSRRLLLTLMGSALALSAYGGDKSKSSIGSDGEYTVEGDYILGEANAPVTLVEYASVACGGCAYWHNNCLLYTSPSPRDQRGSRMPSSA